MFEPTTASASGRQQKVPTGPGQVSGHPSHGLGWRVAMPASARHAVWTAAAGMMRFKLANGAQHFNESVPC
jgi:hypothetical protein